MSLASLEKVILAGLKKKTGDQKLTRNSIMEWSTSPVKASEGELLAEIDDPHVYVAYKPSSKKK